MPRAGDDAESPSRAAVAPWTARSKAERSERSYQLTRHRLAGLERAVQHVRRAIMKPTVSAIALADTRPARSWSSIASVNRVNVLAVGDARSAYFDSRNSTKRAPDNRARRAVFPVF
jgi:hypothetical protein